MTFSSPFGEKINLAHPEKFIKLLLPEGGSELSCGLGVEMD